MRGPGVRLDNDVRRTWTCPACKKQRRLPGDLTSPLGFCRADGVQMQFTADSKVLRRAERLTPLPYLKQPLPDGWHIPDPVEEIAAAPISRPDPEPEARLIFSQNPVPIPSTVPAPESNMEAAAPDEFGADLDVPLPPPQES